MATEWQVIEDGHPGKGTRLGLLAPLRIATSLGVVNSSQRGSRGGPLIMAARRSWKGLVLNVLLSLAAFGPLGWTVWRNRAKLGEIRARNPDLRLFVAAVGLYVGALLVTFLRWHRLVRALGLPFRLRDAVRLGFIGNVSSTVAQ